MTIAEWFELLLTNQERLALIVDKFCPDKLQSFCLSCTKRDDYTTHKILGDVWFKVPDKPWIHSIDGWGVLCDLCSEYPEQE